MNSQTIDGLLQKRIVRARRAKLLGWLLGLVLVAGAVVGVYAAVTAPGPSEAEPTLQSPDSNASVTPDQADPAVSPEGENTAPDVSEGESTAPDVSEGENTAPDVSEGESTAPDAHEQTASDPKEEQPTVQGDTASQSEPSATVGTQGSEPTTPTPTPPTPNVPSPEASGVTPPDGTGSAPEKSPKEIRHSVQVVWFGEGQPPEAIKISVMHDGALILTTELTQAGGWRFDWTDVYHASELELVGRFPDNIKAEFSVSGENITITGTCGVPTAQESGTGAEANFSADADHLLPQTGTKEQPIMILLCLGLALIALGSADIAIRQWKCENEEG